MDFEKLLEQEARKAARQDYEEVTEKTKELFLQIFQSVYPENECDDS